MKKIKITFTKKVFISKILELNDEQFNKEIIQTLLNCDREDFDYTDFDSDELEENPAHILNEIISYKEDIYDLDDEFECFNIEVFDI